MGFTPRKMPERLNYQPTIGAPDFRTKGQVIVDEQLEAAREQNPQMLNPAKTVITGEQQSENEQSAPAKNEFYDMEALARDIEAGRRELSSAMVEDESAQRSDSARKKIGAFADAISALGNFIGTTKGGLDQGPGKTYAMMDNRITRDSQLRRARIQQLQQRLNSQLSQLNSAGLYNYRMAENQRKTEQGDKRIENAAYNAETSRMRAITSADQGQQRIDQGWYRAKTNADHIANQDSVAFRNAGSRATSAAASWMNAKTRSDAEEWKRLHGGEEVNEESKKRKEEVKEAASNENWSATKDKLAKQLFGKNRWVEVDVPKDPEKRKLYESISLAGNQKERIAIIEQYLKEEKGSNNDTSGSVDKGGAGSSSSGKSWIEERRKKGGKSKLDEIRNS